MLYFLISIIFVLQIIGFLKIKELRSKKDIPKNSIILKSIPNNINYLDVDPKMKFLDDIFESIKIENWETNISSHTSTKCWDITFKSNSGIIFKSRLRLFASDGTPYLDWCSIIDTTNNSSIIIDTKNKKLNNKIVPFLWGHLVKYYEDINSEEFKIINNKIINFSNKLKTLNRDRKLNTIFK